MADLLFADAYLAGIYDAWHPRGVRDDFDFYRPWVMAAKAVLDVGCGTGMMLHDTRDAGHAGRLCGLDPAPGMLSMARRRSDIEWVLGDLASARWDGEFDLAVMTGHAFQTLVTDEELREGLSAVARALAKGGRFAFETRNPAACAWERWTPQNAVDVVRADGDRVRITTRVVHPFDGRIVAFTHTFSGDHPVLPLVSESTLRFLDAQAVSALLADAGFVIEAQFGDWDASALTDRSPEIIMIARRA